MKKGANVIQFTYKRSLTMRLPKFRLFKNIRYLDPIRLSKGSHTIELGRFDGCECDCTVKAEIKDGMITRIKHERCKNARPIPAELAKKMKAAHSELTKNSKREWEDIPVKAVIRGSSWARLIDIIIDGNCFMICWDDGRGEQCIMCCLEPNRSWCIGPSEPALHI